MTKPFYEELTSDWLKHNRGPTTGDSQLETILTQEEKDDKFFLTICNLDITLFTLASAAAKYTGYEPMSCLTALGPLTVDNAWQYNILLRTTHGEIKPVVWGGEGWWRSSNQRWSQMPYVSITDKNKIVYTPNIEYGKADRQIITKVGKYLNQNFNEILDDQTIRFWANRHNELYGDHKLHFALTGDDISWVYEHGPMSCMVMDRDNRYIKTITHPVRVYESPDVAVAYLFKTGRTDRVMARTVVNTKNKQWTVIYGDKQILENILRQQGYTPGGLQNCRLKYITDTYNHNILCPYLDGTTINVRVYRDSAMKLWLMVDDNGEYVADTTTGYLDEALETFTCSCCETTCFDNDDDGRHSTYEDGDICSSCMNEYFVEARIDVHAPYYELVHVDCVICVLTNNEEDTTPWAETVVENNENFFIYHDDTWMTQTYYESHFEQEEAA